jgi:septum formation protein
MSSSAPVTLCIGSSSVHRQAIIRAEFGSTLALSTCSPDIDEKAIRDPNPAVLTMAIARAKMAAVVAKLSEGPEPMPAFIVTSDQVALHGGVIREKPDTEDENRAFLRSYRNGSVVTIASFLVKNTATGAVAEGTHEAETFFGDITDAMIERIVARGMTMWCAGGFAIEDPDLKSVLVSVRNGTVSSVQGVHIPLFRKLLVKVGAPVADASADASA